MGLKAAAPLAGRLLLAAALFWTAGTAAGDRPARISPERASILWEDAMDARENGSPRRALALIRKLLRGAPDNPIYLQAEAEAYGQMKNHAAEAASWELFINVTPTPTDACPRLGQAYEKLGRTKQAIAAHRRCLALDPSAVDLMLYLALALEHAGEFSEAGTLYARILANSPGYNDARLGAARLLAWQEKFAEAQAMVEAVIREAPQNADALLAGAILAEKLGRPSRAKELLLAGIKSSPSYADLYRILGRVCDAQGDQSCSLKAFTALAELEPDNKAAQRRLARLRREKP